MPEVDGLKQTVDRLKQEGMPISEYTLRNWVRNKAIPSVRCGRKVLLFYPNVVSYIKTGEQGATEQPAQAFGIRRLEVNK